MNTEKNDALIISDLTEFKNSDLFLGKEAYAIKLRIEEFLEDAQNTASLTPAQRREAEQIIKDSQKVKKGEIRFTAWRIQKAKDIVGVRMITDNVLWDNGPYWYEDSPFWLSSLRGIIPVKEMKLAIDDQFKQELQQHVSKINSFWGKVFEQGMWYFIFMATIGIAYGFWKSDQLIIGGSIAVGLIIGILVFLINKYTGLTTSMEKREQFKSWITSSGDINGDEFLDMLQGKIDLWGPVLESVLKEVKINAEIKS